MPIPNLKEPATGRTGELKKTVSPLVVQDHSAESGRIHFFHPSSYESLTLPSLGGKPAVKTAASGAPAFADSVRHHFRFRLPRLYVLMKIPIQFR